jgi:hypothetical protein
VSAEHHCIYCERALPPATKPAHIFPEGLGGRLASTTTVCDDCNNSFSEIEGDACLRLAAMGAFRGARRGDRKFIKADVEYQGSRFRVENARMDESAKPPRNRGREWPMPARREDQIVTCANALRAKRLPPEAMLDGRFLLQQDDDVAPVESEQTEPVEHVFVWGDRNTKRLMIKIAIELLAYFAPEGARSEALERPRRFARYDEGHDMDFPAGPDTETAGARLPVIEATWFHGIEIWRSERKLNYRITLFSNMRWVGTLTECWTGSPLSASYTFDVTDPGRRSVETEPRDGATLVRKSHRVRKRENDLAVTAAETANFEIAERRAGRAPTPSFEDLYPDVKALMEKRGWIPKS